jgi:SAM-dependent methyltransferase
VTAIDISPGMVAELRRKAAAEGRTSLIATQVGEIARLDGEPESVRGIVSAFAALNTVADLDDFAARAHRLLRSRGRLILHMLSPAGVRRGGQPPAHADERDDPDTGQPPARRTRQIDVCGQPIPHRMATAREVYRGAFAGRFALRRVWALGFLCPSRVTRRLPAWLAHLQGRLETGVGRWRPFVDLGRFYVLDMEKREAPASEERRR